MKYYYLLLLLVVFPYIAKTEINQNYALSDSVVSISHSLSILEDSKRNIKAEDLINSKLFKASSSEVPNLQISNSIFWVKFKLTNRSNENKFIIELPFPTIDTIILYTIIDNKITSIDSLGEFVPINKRYYKHQNYLFKCALPIDSSATYLMKINGSEQMQVPLNVGSDKDIFENIIKNDLIFGIYAGLILVMLLYNLFIYVTVKDIIYLYYVFYIFTVGLTQACVQGYSFLFYTSYSANLANLSMVIAPAFSGITTILFVKKFLQVKNFLPLMDKFLSLINIIYFIAISIGLSGYFQISQGLIQLLASLGSLTVLFISFRIMQIGYRPAYFFVVAWSIFLSSIIVFVLKNFNVLPYNNFTHYALQVGSGLEMILLSLALADRIKTLQNEKEESQLKTLQVSQENEKIIREQNIILEAKVEERTYALQKSNTDLSTTLSELKQTQSQLVNAEKMASLGQLTAGIAHEINNPINFVLSNVKPLRRDIEDIQEIITKYDHILPEEQKGAIDKYKKEIDYQYVQEEINTLLNGIEEGAKRTSDIIKGLRVFSRLDENDLKRADLIEGIESTLSLLNTELSNKVTVVKNYKQIPPVECFPGKLNQVFMNILNNAIYAIIAHVERKEKGLLTIDTLSDNLNVYIKITDNGTGMTDDVKAKLFEPFFTTKDVGKGTGLGLSICYSIIQDHKGTIKVDTEYGKGTTFIITLPINQV